MERKRRDVRARRPEELRPHLPTGQAEGRAVRVRELAAGGDGFALLDGEAVFVARSAPGDLVELAQVRAARGVLFARCGRLLEPGEPRRPAPCPWYQECGGCAWQHLPYPFQTAEKGRILAQTLQRVGRIGAGEPFPVHPSPSEFGWRHRLRLHQRGGRFGFFRQGSHEVVEWGRCLLLPEGLNRAIGVTREALAGHPLLPALSAVEMTLAEDGSVLSLLWRLAPPAVPRWRELAGAVAPALSGPGCALAQGVAVGEGAAAAEWEGPRVPVRSGTGGAVSLASPGAFTQVNPGQNARLVDAAMKALHGTPGPLLDLYCGNGNFALAAAREGREVWGVESHPGAVEDARAALKPGMRATFTAEAVEEFVHRPLPAPAGGAAWSVLADPPRTGLPTAVRRALARWEVPLVVYVSCNPATFARDLGHLLALGYSLESLAAFDLFPQTPHVEALAVLRRGS